jgi:hypothetical protein
VGVCAWARLHGAAAAALTTSTSDKRLIGDLD